MPGWSVAVVIGDVGTSFAVWSSLTCMPMKSMAVQILAGSMACVCHTVNTDLKVANVCGFLQCVTLSCVKQCLTSLRK